MPQINLSSLSGPELRQRLDSSRARGDAALAYEILREMEARRAEAGRRRANRKRRAGEPRIVDVDLGDPLDKGDELPAMPHWRAPELVAAETAEAEAARPTPPQDPPRFRTLDAPLALVEPEPPPTPRPPEREPEPLTLEPQPPAEPHRNRARSGHGLRIAAGFAVGITSGVALGWFAADLVRETPAAAAPPQAVLQVAQQAVTPPVVETPELPPEPPAPDVTVAEAPAAGEAAVPAASVEPERPVFAQTDAPPPAADACAAETTPADREICADPDLQRLQRDLRRAYAEALAAHDDRALLRQRQLAWRDARSGVSDPARLARLYEQRIRRLDAAAAQARALRQAGDES